MPPLPCHLPQRPASCCRRTRRIARFVQVHQYLPDFRRFVNESDDPHRAAALRAGEWKHFAPQEFPSVVPQETLRPLPVVGLDAHADTSIFYHAFVEWAGMAPVHYRQQWADKGETS